MKCPTGCESLLVIADRQGIEIDYCPTCRGVWLDRGELDRLIERAAAEYAPAPAGYDPPPAHAAYAQHPPPVQSMPPSRPPGSPPPYGYDPRYQQSGKRKKRGFLEDIFDFG